MIKPSFNSGYISLNIKKTYYRKLDDGTGEK